MNRRLYVRRRDLALAEWRHAWDYGTQHEKEQALTKAAIASARLRAFDAAVVKYPVPEPGLVDRLADHVVSEERRELARCYMNG